MGPWAHRKLFWPPPPCFPHPPAVTPHGGTAQSTEAARPPHQATEPSGCFSLLPSAPVTRPLGNFREVPVLGGGGASGPSNSNVLVCTCSNVRRFPQLNPSYSFLILAPVFVFGRVLSATTASLHSTTLSFTLQSARPCGSRSGQGYKSKRGEVIGVTQQATLPQAPRWAPRFKGHGIQWTQAIIIIITISYSGEGGGGTMKAE